MIVIDNKIDRDCAEDIIKAVAKLPTITDFDIHCLLQQKVFL